MPRCYLVTYAQRRIKTIGLLGTKGYLFDSSYDGELEPEFDPTVKMLLDNTVPGFYTAVQQMVNGDKWRVYIPTNLGYGAEEKGYIPAYSALIFEIDLVSFSSPKAK